ncbi:hypothetical protein SAMN05661010_01778 [Modicisalibacter muralis]|uniref:Uncharacterized protein n=1 Tax=Modicisalibacter muralis TaxID=119000 RepID=A0A1G9KHQ8_9GAMM|nr:hypothetical protein [Halomonas muralis]SDL48965.1 hypothetical protein SAMN05661010_01778 [Halomonas muralis]
MHKHIDWDLPGAHSVSSHYARDPNPYGKPHAGTILTARYQGATVRVRVEAYLDDDDTSIGEVVALVDPLSGERMKNLGKLTLGDLVRLPDEKRAFETAQKSQDD